MPPHAQRPEAGQPRGVDQVARDAARAPVTEQDEQRRRPHERGRDQRHVGVEHAERAEDREARDPQRRRRDRQADEREADRDPVPGAAAAGSSRSPASDAQATRQRHGDRHDRQRVQQLAAERDERRTRARTPRASARSGTISQPDRRRLRRARAARRAPSRRAARRAARRPAPRRATSTSGSSEGKRSTAITARWSLRGIRTTVTRSTRTRRSTRMWSIVSGSARRCLRRRGPGRLQPCAGGVGGVDVAAVEQRAELGMVERGVEVAGEDLHVARSSAPGSAASAARHSGSAARLTGGRGCTDVMRTGGAPVDGRSRASGCGSSPVDASGRRDSSPPPAAPRSGTQDPVRELVGLERGASSAAAAPARSARPRRARARSAAARARSACPSHRFDVITTSRGPSASGCGPATARGTIANPSATRGHPRHDARRPRRSTSAAPPAPATSAPRTA